MAQLDVRFDASGDTTPPLETVANPRRVRVDADGSPVVAAERAAR